MTDISTDSLIRCPVRTVNVSLLVNHTAPHQLLLDGNSNSWWWSRWINEESQQMEPNDAFPFASTTILYAILAVECLCFAVLLYYRYHGFRVTVSSSSRQGDTPATVVNGDASPEGYGSFASARSGGAAVVQHDLLNATLRTVHCYTKGTDNRHWTLYFASLFVLRCIGIGSLQVATNDSHGEEAGKILWLLERVVHGLSCVWLANSLNYQRIYRVVEYRNAKVNGEVLKRATWINRISFALFVTFCVADYICAHRIFPSQDGTVSSSTTHALYWVYIATLLLLACPTILSALWVVLHQGAVYQPSGSAKLLLSIGVLSHLVLMLPPSLWNRHMLRHWVDTNPCPLHVFSFFDLLLIFHVLCTLLIFLFAVLEHHRNASVAHKEHFVQCEKRLLKQEAKQEFLRQQSSLLAEQIGGDRRGEQRLVALGDGRLVEVTSLREDVLKLQHGDTGRPETDASSICSADAYRAMEHDDTASHMSGRTVLKVAFF